MLKSDLYFTCKKLVTKMLSFFFQYAVLVCIFFIVVHGDNEFLSGVDVFGNIACNSF